MIVELLIFTLFGIALGIFTGITPGIHVNTVILTLAGFAFITNPYYSAVIIIAMAITHTIFDFAPSVLLGVPEPMTALSVLPGHRLLLEGKGYEAMYLTVIGGVGAMFLTLLTLPLLLILIPFFYQNIQYYIHWALIAIATTMILIEPTLRKRLYALLVFLLSGILGIITLNSFLLPSNFVFFPTFTGLFGLSTLLISLNRKTKIPEQKTEIEKIPRKKSLSGIVKGLFSGMIIGTLPGVGAAQATVLSQQITRRRDHKEFLISVGAINTIVALFSLISLHTISRARSGAAIAVQGLLTDFGFNELLLLVAVALFATGISAILMLKMMKKTISFMQRINYTKLTLLIILFLITLTAIFTGPIGLFILFVSTSIGLLAPLFGVKRSTCMGFLMLHLILFYSGLSIFI